MKKILKFFADKKRLCVLIFAVFFLIYTIFGFFGIPYIITKVLPSKMPNKVSLNIQNAKFNPFTYELNITNLDLRTQIPLFKAKKIDADIKFTDFFKKNLNFESLILKSPQINIAKDKNGNFNFASLLENNETENSKEEKNSGFNLILKYLKIENGTIKYADNSLKEPFVAAIDNINYELTDFDLKQNIGGNHRFGGDSSIMENVNIESKVDLNPFKIYGKIDIKNLNINPFWLSFVPDNTNLKNGIINSNLLYFLKFDNGIKFYLKDSNLSISDFSLSLDKNSSEDANFKELILKNFNIHLLYDKDIKTDAKLEKFYLQDANLSAFNYNLNFKNLNSGNVKFNMENQNFNVKIPQILAQTTKLDFKKKDFFALSKIDLKDINISKENNTTMVALQDFNASNFDLNKFINFKSLYVKNIKFDEKSLKIKNADLNELNFNSEITENGVTALNSLALLKTSKNTVKKEKSNFKFELENFSLNNASAQISESFITKMTHRITGINLNIKNFSLDKDFNITTNINSSQIALKSNGNLKISPLRFSGKISAKLKNLTYFNPYLNEFLNADIKSGEINTDGNLKFTDNFNFSGNFSAENFILNDKNGKFFGIRNLSVKNAKITPKSAVLSDINISYPYAKLFIDKNRNFNAIDIIKSNKKSAAQNENNFDFTLKNIKLLDGEIDFIDHSLIIPFDIKISKVKTAVNKVASKGLTKLDFNGLVGKNGTGKIKIVTLPFNYDQRSHMEVIFKNVALKDATPYSAKFIGYEIKDGKLNLKLDYKIKDKKLVAKNNINLDHFTLGKKVESKDNVNLPVSLAVSILTDQNGQINVDLPVNGDLNNPDFSYGGIVWSAVGKLFSDIVLSPFRFIGNVLGIDTSKLEGIDFEFASSEILDSENEKFENIKHILDSKPEIKLTLTPTYNEKGDTFAFKEESFHKNIDLIINQQNVSYKEAIQILKHRYSIREDKNLKNLIINAQKFTPSRLDELAEKRAKNVKDKLIEIGVNSAQIIIKDIQKTDAKQNTYVSIGLGIEK